MALNLYDQLTVTQNVLLKSDFNIKPETGERVFRVFILAY